MPLHLPSLLAEPDDRPELHPWLMEKYDLLRRRALMSAIFLIETEHPAMNKLKGETLEAFKEKDADAQAECQDRLTALAPLLEIKKQGRLECLENIDMARQLFLSSYSSCLTRDILHMTAQDDDTYEITPEEFLLHSLALTRKPRANGITARMHTQWQEIKNGLRSRYLVQPKAGLLESRANLREFLEELDTDSPHSWHPNG